MNKLIEIKEIETKNESSILSPEEMIKKKASELAKYKQEEKEKISEIELEFYGVISKYKEYQTKKKEIENTLDENISKTENELLDLSKTFFEIKKKEAKGINIDTIKFNQDDCHFQIKEVDTYQITNYKKFVEYLSEEQLREYLQINEKDLKSIVSTIENLIQNKKNKVPFFKKDKKIIVSHTVRGKE